MVVQRILSRVLINVKTMALAIGWAIMALVGAYSLTLSLATFVSLWSGEISWNINAAVLLFGFGITGGLLSWLAWGGELPITND